MSDLNELRKEIDRIDDEIIKNFIMRLEVSKKVAQYKAEKNMEVLQSDREREINEKIKRKAPEGYEAHFVKLFDCILEISKNVQAEMVSKVEGK